jgi:hypothetical protein
MQSMLKGTVTASCNLLHRHDLGWSKGFHDGIITVVCARLYEYYFIRQLASLFNQTFPHNGKKHRPRLCAILP